MTSETRTGLLGLAAVPLGFALDAWTAFVLSAFWTWFAVPLGLPHIGPLHMLGLCMMVGVYRMTNKASTRRIGEMIEGAFVKAFAISIVLGFGWLVQAVS